MKLSSPDAAGTAAAAASTAACRVGDAVLCRYLAERGRSLPREPAVRGEQEEMHLVYVAGFAASQGTAPGGAGPAGSEPAGALCALRALDALGTGGTRGRRVRTNAIFVEEDPVLAARLRAQLELAGFSERVRETEELDTLAPGEIAVVTAAFAERAPELARYTAPPRHALYFLDPPAARMLPLAALHPLLQQERTELVIAFPAAELHKQARFRDIPLADLPPYARRLVEGYSQLFGERGYEWLRLWRQTEREAGAEGGPAAEARMLEHYRARLAEGAPGAAVRWVPVAAPEAAGSTFLFLATGNPERALLLNRVLHDARLAGEVAWGDSLSGLVRVEDTGVLDLFAPAERPARAREVQLQALAHEIATTFAGETVSFRQVLMQLVDTDLLVEEIKRAMGMLKREGRAFYASLEIEAEVSFPPPRQI